MGVDILVINEHTQKGQNKQIMLDVLAKLIIALEVVKSGKNTMLKCIDINENIWQDVIYILAFAFRKVYLVKTLAENLNNDIHYIIATDKLVNVNSLTAKCISLLEKCKSQCYNNRYNEHNRLLPNNFNNSEFTEWLTGYMNDIESYRNELSSLSQEGVTNLYDMFKAKAIWNLP